MPSVVFCHAVVFIAAPIAVVAVVVRIVIDVLPLCGKKVQFENGSYGLSLGADLEVFAPNNVVFEFWITIVKTKDHLYVRAHGPPITSTRDSMIGLEACVSCSVFL